VETLRSALPDDVGASIVEFALVAPVLILILVGILDFGRAINAYVTVGNAAREGTHYVSLHPTAAPSAIASAVRQRVVPLDPSEVEVCAEFNNGSTFVPWPASPTPNVPVVSTSVRVSVSYPWSAATFIGHFFPGGTGPTCVSPPPTPATAWFTATSTVDMLR
jgi:Flp pilus assembly protein TadG